MMKAAPSERGVVLTEFALSIPVVLVIIGCTLYLSSVMREHTALVEAVRHGARTAGASFENGVSVSVAQKNARQMAVQDVDAYLKAEGHWYTSSGTLSDDGTTATIVGTSYIVTGKIIGVSTMDPDGLAECNCVYTDASGVKKVQDVCGGMSALQVTATPVGSHGLGFNNYLKNGLSTAISAQAIFPAEVYPACEYFCDPYLTAGAPGACS